jgi:5-(carboxyamino)imidazole ribonucleotide synthase
VSDGLSRAPQRPADGRATTLGVLGGGQLGRMFVHAAQVHGYRVVVLEPDASSPAGAAADLHLLAPYTDEASLATLAGRCSAVTTEFENVPAGALRRLMAACAVSPPADAVEVCQHRAREKQLFAAAGVPFAPHALVDSVAAAQDPATWLLCCRASSRPPAWATTARARPG